MYIQSPLHVSSDKHSFLFKKKKKRKTNGRASIDFTMFESFLSTGNRDKEERERERQR